MNTPRPPLWSHRPVKSADGIPRGSLGHRDDEQTDPTPEPVVHRWHVLGNDPAFAVHEKVEAMHTGLDAGRNDPATRPVAGERLSDPGIPIARDLHASRTLDIEPDRSASSFVRRVDDRSRRGEGDRAHAAGSEP